MGILLYLLLIYGVFRVARKSFQFEKISRFELVTIPAYSALMFVLSMRWDGNDVLLLIGLVIVAALIGWFQSLKVIVQPADQTDKHGRPIVKVKQGWPYVVGWLLVFALGVVVEVWHTGQFELVEILKELGHEVREDLFLFLKFGDDYAWYLWAVAATASTTYTWLLRRKDQAVSAAIRRPDRSKNKSK
jgi:hypothetical protein